MSPGAAHAFLQVVWQCIHGNDEIAVYRPIFKQVRVIGSRIVFFRINLLFTDVVLPGGMNGPALAAEVRRRRSEIKVLFMSGYNEKGIIHQAQLDEGAALLNKPFGKADLARKLRQVLDCDGIEP